MFLLPNPPPPPPPRPVGVFPKRKAVRKKGGISGVGDGATHQLETILEERGHLIIRI